LIHHARNGLAKIIGAVIKNMKAIFLTVILLILFIPVFGQTELDIANQRLDKTLDLVQKRDGEIIELKNLVEKLKASQATPCSIAVQTATADLVFWHAKYQDATPETRREVGKTLKQRRSEGSRLVQRQCDFQNPKTAMGAIWEGVKQYAPIAVLLLMRK
jgi:hypothetical protein